MNGAVFDSLDRDLFQPGSWERWLAGAEAVERLGKALSFAALILGAAAPVLGAGSVDAVASAQSIKGAKFAGGELGRTEGAHRIRVGDKERTFSYYVPKAMGSRPALIVALHGGVGSGERLRGFIGNSLEALADRYGFIIAYPDGFEGHWNGCRRAAQFSANRQGIDDVAFIRALIARFEERHGVDPSRVYALGFSNGGHMAYRLALEIPQAVRAVAAFAASLPEEDNLDCAPSGHPASVMIVNGTGDRINPYKGGEVLPPSGRRLGRVRSSQDSARYFVRLAGTAEKSNKALIAAADKEDTWVEKAIWRAKDYEVRLYTVHGGGHVIPGSEGAFPAFLGKMEKRFDAVQEAVRFFLNQLG